MLDKIKSMHHHSFIFVVVITLLLVASAPTTNASLLRGHNKIDRGEASRQITNANKETKRKMVTVADNPDGPQNISLM